ncbi:MAG: hypothetical protein HFJ29_06165 [Clostridia bacterium]|nr:hypothetical protein [Clostridia bacterium]
MGPIILKMIAITLVALGVVCIFDARVITKKVFSFGDQNEGSLGLKILGFIVAIVGAIIYYLVLR